MANEELDEVFDAYFADSDLWVTILTGAGEQAFSGRRITATDACQWGLVNEVTPPGKALDAPAPSPPASSRA
jgi:enoyl-CoA hydratase/carnithine racemase